MLALAVGPRQLAHPLQASERRRVCRPAHGSVRPVTSCMRGTHGGIGYGVTMGTASLAALLTLQTFPMGEAGARINSVQRAALEGRIQAEGTADVVDGDTLRVDGVRIRLLGIDAPEIRQTCFDQSGARYPCGERSADELRSLTGYGKRRVKCITEAQDRYGRLVGECFADGKSLNKELVSEGWAVAYSRYSDRFQDAEARASRSHAGMWDGTFETPEEYRTHKRISGRDDSVSHSDAKAPLGKCNIKGNISTSGEKIYHTPGSPYFNRVSPKDSSYSS